MIALNGSHGEARSWNTTTTILAEEILTPDAIRPEQFDVIWHCKRATTPERALLLAMIEQAASDLRRFRYARQRPDQRLYMDAYKWVVSEDRSHPFTFVNICEGLSLSPDGLREALLREPRETAVHVPQRAVA